MRSTIVYIRATFATRFMLIMLAYKQRWTSNDFCIDKCMWREKKKLVTRAISRQCDLRSKRHTEVKFNFISLKVANWQHSLDGQSVVQLSLQLFHRQSSSHFFGLLDNSPSFFLSLTLAAFFFLLFYAPKFTFCDLADLTIALKRRAPITLQHALYEWELVGALLDEQNTA